MSLAHRIAALLAYAEETLGPLSPSWKFALVLDNFAPVITSCDHARVLLAEAEQLEAHHV